MLSALWSDEAASAVIIEHLEVCAEAGSLIISGPVYCELRAHPSLNEVSLLEYLAQREIEVDWVLDRQVWNEAASCVSHYAARRRRNRIGTPSRLLADFVIGAHALVRADQLFTSDANRYRTYFPLLRLVEP